MIQIFKGFKSTLPRPAPQDLPIFAGRGKTSFFAGRGGAGQPFFRGAGRGGAGRTSLLGRSRKKNLCKKASQIKITFEAAALLPARVVILICEHIAATEGAPSPQPDMAAPSLITAFTPLPPNAPGRGFFWKPTA